jgi:peptide/nickel transport system substrate-binding protein
MAIAAENAESGLIHTSIARYLGPTYAQGGTNVASSDNPEGMADYEAGMNATDPDEQCANFEAAQKTILERVDMTPLITDTHRYVARKGFASYVFSGYWDISAMRIVS